MIFYIGDMHLGTNSSIKFDNRPFKDVDDMDNRMISMWNKKVSDDDEVYIVGDLTLKGSTVAKSYLDRMKGTKNLIIGNHDYRMLKSKSMLQYFNIVDNLIRIKDCDRDIVICHYPIIDWNGMYRGSWHIYGHIHNSDNPSNRYMKTLDKALNCAACINGYAPVTFDELLVNNIKWKSNI